MNYKFHGAAEGRIFQSSERVIKGVEEHSTCSSGKASLFHGAQQTHLPGQKRRSSGGMQSFNCSLNNMLPSWLVAPLERPLNELSCQRNAFHCRRSSGSWRVLVAAIAISIEPRRFAGQRSILTWYSAIKGKTERFPSSPGGTATNLRTCRISEQWIQLFENLIRMPGSRVYHATVNWTNNLRVQDGVIQGVTSSSATRKVLKTFEEVVSATFHGELKGIIFIGLIIDRGFWVRRWCFFFELTRFMTSCWEFEYDPRFFIGPTLNIIIL